MKKLLTAGLLAFSSTLIAQNISGSWKGILDAGTVKLNIVFHFQKGPDGKEVCLMDSPDQSVKGIPTKLQYISADSVSVSVPALFMEYNGKLRNNTIEGVFKQGGATLKLDLEQGEVKRNRPQTPATPYPYTTEEVTFKNAKADVTLAGTLSYPVGYRKGDKVPVVLMVSGSGGQNRDSELFDHPYFLVIADYLARHGIASLRYDDRAIGASTGSYQAANTREVADDAKAGIEYLRNLHQFSQVGLLGHSEGGCVAFMLGAEKELDFAISMAGTGLKGDELLFTQAQAISEKSGIPFKFSKEEFLQTVKARKNPWMDFFMAYNPKENIERMSCPILALHGEKDMQVIASTNASTIKAYLPKNIRSEVKIYQGLNHLFQPCTTGLPTEYASIEQTIDPSVLEDIATWINQLTEKN